MDRRSLHKSGFTSFILNDARCFGSDGGHEVFVDPRVGGNPSDEFIDDGCDSGLPPSRSYNDFSLASAPLIGLHTPTRTIKKVAKLLHLSLLE